MTEEKRNLPKPPLPSGLGVGIPNQPSGIPKTQFPSGAAQGVPAPPGIPKGAPLQKSASGTSRGIPMRPPMMGVTTTEDVRDVELARRINDMERKSDEISESKNMLENQIKDLEEKLQQEKEKVLLASLRSKEEAALATKVEIALKEMQERLRRDRQTQELDDSRRKAEERIKELEQKLVEERETWMQTLKDQLGQKDMHDNDIEDYLAQRVGELEEQWQEEKEAILYQLKEKEELLIKQQQEYLLKEEQLKKHYESEMHQLNIKSNKQNDELQNGIKQLIDEKQKIAIQLEEDEKALINVRAQISLIQSQSRLEKDKTISEWQLRFEGEERKHQELKQKNIRIEEELKTLQKRFDELANQNQLQITSSQNQVYIVKQEFEQQRDEILKKHNEEKEVWKQSLLELENKIVKEKEAWERELESYRRAWLREREALLNEREQLIRKSNNVDELLKNQREEMEKKVNEARTQMVIRKSETEKDNINRIDEIKNEFKLLEKKYWDERDILAEALSTKEKEIESLAKRLNETQALFNNNRERYENEYKNLETKYWEEKENSTLRLSEKDDEITQLKRQMSQQGIELKKKMEHEYQLLVDRMEREKTEWSNKVLLEFEQSSLDKVERMQFELRSVREALLTELNEFEKRMAEDSHKWESLLKDKEKEIAVLKTELNGVYQEKVHRESMYRGVAQDNSGLRARLESIQQALQIKENELERFRTDIFHTELHKLKTEMELKFQQERTHWETVVRQKENDLMQMSMRIKNEEAAKSKNTDELSKRFQDELSILESRFQRQIDDQRINVVRKIWRYLNRTVLIINFGPYRWFRKKRNWE
ncbi:MAG: hypothetical protein ABII27_05720 [bacterium]